MQIDDKFISFINEHFIQIKHPSSTNENEFLKVSTNMGRCIEEVICSVYSLGINDIQDQSFSPTIQRVKSFFEQYVHINFPLTEVYKKTEFGLGCGPDVKCSRNTIIYLFRCYLSALADQNLTGLIEYFVKNMPTVYVASTKDSKTLLQEYYQAHGKGTPIYRTSQNPNYEQHTPVFDSYLTFWNGKDFFAKGEGKKKAEQNLALLLCKYLDIIPPKKALKIKRNIFDFSTYLKSDTQNHFCNSRINGAFALPAKFNSVVAFIPPRFIGQDRTIRSHRLLATLGSNYVYLLWFIAKREMLAKTNLDKVQKWIGTYKAGQPLYLKEGSFSLSKPLAIWC